MKQGMSLQELATTVIQHASGKEDLIAPPKAMAFSITEKNAIQLSLGDRDFNLTANATNQVEDFLGIPRRYASRLASEVPELLATNLNTLSQRAPGRRMVRTMHGDARAFMSDSYRRIDNEMVFDGMFPLLKKLGARMESTNVSEYFMHLQATFAVEGEIRKGDVVRYGVAIRNSEVGRGALSVSPLLFRLVCTNGMVVADQSKRRAHVGGSYLSNDDSSWVALSSETQLLKTRAVIAELGEYLEFMASPDSFQKTLGMLRAVADQPLPAEPTMVVESLGARYSLAKGETESALLALAEGRDYSRWGLANAITVLANSSENYDRSVELETLGGRIMQMPAKEYSAMSRMPKSSEIELPESEMVHA